MLRQSELKRTPFKRHLVSEMKPKKGPKPRKCANRACDNTYLPGNDLRVCWCSIECGLVVAQERAAKKKAKEARIERAETKKRLEKIVPMSVHLDRTQAVINAYVRLRDADKGCISCPRPASWGGQWHASHYKSRGANSALRFNLWNLHKACSICNNHLSGNMTGYVPGLIERIGQEKVDMLDNFERSRTYTIEYLARMRKVFNKKMRRLEKRLGLN
jgi:hypothetical protein